MKDKEWQPIKIDTELPIIIYYPRFDLKYDEEIYNQDIYILNDKIRNLKEHIESHEDDVITFTRN